MRAGSARGAQGGFTYLGALFLIVLLGIGIAGTGDTWWLASRRARERELLWVGNQYARAIRAYHAQSPGLRQYPSRLDELLADRRFPEPRHHLRQLYPDPISREAFTIVPGPDGRIAGVRSPSEETPLKQENFPQRWKDFQGSTRYSDWVFLAEPPARPASQATGGTSASGNPAAAAEPPKPRTAFTVTPR